MAKKRTERPIRRVYLIQTGSEQWRQEATTILEAVMAAFARRPPKAPGKLIRVQRVLQDGHMRTDLLDAARLLKRVGLQMKETGPTDGQKYKVVPL